MDARTLNIRVSLAGAGLLVLGSLVYAGSTFAATNDAAAAYKAQRAVCERGQTHQDKATCLREAGAAYEEARRGRLLRGASPDYDADARLRCERHTGEAREECLLLQDRSGNVKVHGSVEGGGTLRETTIRRVGEPPVPPERGVVTTPQNVHPGAIPSQSAPGFNPLRPNMTPPVAPGNGMRSGTGIR